MTDALAFHIEILPTDNADIDALSALMHASIHGLGPRAYSDEQIHAWSPAARQGETARKRFADQTAFVARDELGPAAFMTLTSQGYLDFAYAHPRAAGKGAATQIYLALEAYARHQQMAVLTSDISLTAQHFFQKRGWTVVRTQHPVLNGVALTNYHMMKKLVP